MRIDGTRRSGGASRARKGEPSGGSDNVFSLSEAGRQGGASSASGPSSIGGIDALLALQSVDENAGRGARLKHGHEVLDLLEDIKLDLLSGNVTVAKLQRLVDTVSRRPDRQGEEKIEAVLDEIELRARVELAKHGREAA